MTASHRTAKRDATNTLGSLVAGFHDPHREAHHLGNIADKLTEADLLELIEIVSASRNAGRRDEAAGTAYFRAWAQELQAAAVTLISRRDEARKLALVGTRPGPTSAEEALRAATIPPADRKAGGPTFQQDRSAGRSLQDTELAADPLGRRRETFAGKARRPRKGKARRLAGR